MARVGDAAGREHSAHYLAAVAGVAVVVAVMAWLTQNRTLAAAATALGLYSLHLFSIRFLIENQKRQQRVLDAQWEVLQRFIGTDEGAEATAEELVPAMPIDRDAPERARTERIAVGETVPPAESLQMCDEDDLVSDLEDDEGRTTRPAGSEGPRSPGTEVPVPRHFALGTVALVRNLLSPAEVARVLLEQRMQPGKKFGVLAVEMGLLTDSEREELLLAQQEGLFTDGEMAEARKRLREFRQNAAHSMAGLD